MLRKIEKYAVFNMKLMDSSLPYELSWTEGPFTLAIYYAIAIVIIIRLKNRLCTHFSDCDYDSYSLHRINCYRNLNRVKKFRCK